jgi:DNA ligase D-like protein (predicted ligase)
VKRLAVRTEDHPVTYGGFEGLIPEGEYGGGAVIVWDTGRWVPMSENPEADIASGHIKFRLDGHKLKGGYALVKLKGGRASEKDWLLVKERDIYAKPEADGVVTEDATESVVSGRTVAEIEAALAPAPRAKVAKPRAAKLPGAVAGDCPERLEPALASLVDEPPEGSDWLHEIKFDGYRTIAHLRDGRATMRTRNGHDWTERYGAIAAELGQLPCQSAVIDGEVCVQLPSGATSFAALQDALAEGADHRMVFFAFDLAYLDGYDLRRVPLERRKRALLGLLQDRLGATSALQFGDHAEGSGHEFFAHAANLGLEGIVSKGRHSPYVSGRSRDWLKTKGAHAGEFVVVGFDESKAAGGLGALVLAETANHKLRYAGKVGTGFSAAEAQRLLRSLHKLRREAPIATLIAREETETADTVWVQPKLVVEVEYANRTPKGHLRAPRFKGVRADKPADSAPVNKPKLVTDSVWPRFGSPTRTASCSARTARPSSTSRSITPGSAIGCCQRSSIGR